MTTPAKRPIPRPAEAVLFDMDGVLVDTFDAWVSVLEECRARRGMAPLGIEAIRACWGQGINADCETLFPGEDPARLAREYDVEFLRQLGNVRPEEGVAETVRAIRRAGMRTAVVTNSPVALARTIVGQIGLAGEFDCLAGGDEVSRGKPDPDLLFLALRRLEAAPTGAVMVGDTSLDIAAASACGVASIGYRVGGGDARVDRLADLIPLLDLAPRPRN
jgi:phosphoglycolate phosphatase